MRKLVFWLPFFFGVAVLLVGRGWRFGHPR